jgi:hypothetical protein
MDIKNSLDKNSLYPHIICFFLGDPFCNTIFLVENFNSLSSVLFGSSRNFYSWDVANIQAENK